MRELLLALSLALMAACSESRVTPPPPPDSVRAASIVVTAARLQAFPQDTVRFAASVRDSAGQTMDVRVTTWTSSDPTMVVVDSTGLANAVNVPEGGSWAVTIAARFGHATGSTTLALKWRGPFVIFPDTNVLAPGMTRQLTARENTHLYGAFGPTLDTLAASWRVLDSTVATVSPTGLLVARGLGTTTIEATANGRVARAELTVVTSPSVRFVALTSGYQTIARASSNEEFWHSRTCGLTAAGEVYCWGAGSAFVGPSDRCETVIHDRTGTNLLVSYPCREVPVQLPTNFRFTAISAPTSLGCGITGANRIYCWGSNLVGELGTRSTDSTTHGVTAIASTDEFRSVHVSLLPYYSALTVCGLRMDNVLVCWGYGFGPTPTVVSAGTSWMRIADAGRCGIRADSTAACFESSWVRPQTSTRHWTRIVPGRTSQRESLCGTTASNEVFCGDTLESRITNAPATVDDLRWFTIDSQAATGNICVLSDGDVYCYTKVDLGGLKLKTFSGNCGIGIDDRTYCWHGLGGGVVQVKAVPGQ